MKIPKIKTLQVLTGYNLRIEFDDGNIIIYNVIDDAKSIPSYKPLITERGLFENASVDESRTVVYWNDCIDLPSDILYEYGVKC